MKTERAIELLHRLQDEQFDGIHGDERREALEMAVRALEQNLVKESGGLVKDLVKDCISRKMAIDAINNCYCGGEDSCGEPWIYEDDAIKAVEQLPSAQSETHDKRTETHACDLINRQQAIDAVVSAMIDGADAELVEGVMELLPSAQPEQRYTEEELRVFKHGISLSLLSKRSSQHWQYDEDTATEIKFLERLYEKVSADMRGAE